MKKIISLTALIVLFSNLFTEAQIPSGDVHQLNFSSTLPYVIFFYSITFISLGLFLMKLLKPRFPSYWLYITCIIGIIGAATLTMSFENVKNTQLPKIENSDMKPEDLEPHIRAELEMRQREDKNQLYANFWIISIPNVIILALGIFSDFNNRKRDLSKPRGRYD